MGNKKAGTYDPKNGVFIKHQYKLDEPLAKCIGETFNPKIVADLGGGIGHYCKYWQDNFGWHCFCFEGNENAIKESDFENIILTDLSKEIIWEEPRNKFDLVVCLEVGEHIPKEFQNNFIDNIYNISSNNLVLSWAIRGQGGRGHVNCLDNHEVIDLMKQKSFTYIPEVSKKLRNASTFKFFKNTIMVFKKNG